MKSAILALLKTLGIDLGDKASEVESALDKLAAAEAAKTVPAPTPAPTPVATPSPTGSISEDAITRAVQAATGPLQQQLNALGDALAHEKKARETATGELETQRKGQMKLEREKMIDDAVVAGKITKEKREEWLQRAEAAPDVVRGMLDEIPAHPSVNRGRQHDQQKDQQQKGAGGTQRNDEPGREYRVLLDEARSLFTPSNN